MVAVFHIGSIVQIHKTIACLLGYGNKALS